MTYSPFERLEQLQSRFNNATALIFAPGPSLVELWRGRTSEHPKVCVNDAHRDWRHKSGIGVIVENPDVVYGSDPKWWAARHGLPGFNGVKVCMVIDPPKAIAIAAYPDIVHIRRSRLGSIGYDPQLGSICDGMNSGHAACHLAAQLGATLIALIGFDFHNRGGDHYFGNYADSYGSGGLPLTYGYTLSILRRELAKHGKDMVNCTPGSALERPQRWRDKRGKEIIEDGLPFVPLEAVLARRAA